jgi:hypothetical protein
VLLLWLNTIVAAAASTVWLLWALKWYRRRQYVLSGMYWIAAIASVCSAFGFTVILLGGDPTQSAALVRWWIWGTIGMPSAARLIELLREEKRHLYADKLLSKVEKRADKHDEVANGVT